MKVMFNIMEKKWIFFIIALAILAAGALSMLIQGLNLDIEFAGGVVLTYDVGVDFDQSEAETVVRGVLGDHTSAVQRAILETGSYALTVRFSYAGGLNTEAERAEWSDGMRAELNAALSAWFGGREVVYGVRGGEQVVPPTIQAAVNNDVDEDADADEDTDIADETTDEVADVTDETADADVNDAEDVVVPVAADSDNIYLQVPADISPSTGRALAQRTMWMLLIAALIMLIYISIRFELVTACMLVISLIYNVGVMLTVYTLFQIPVNVSFIAALLTVVAYTSNDTIVIFDRIRENMRSAKKETYSSVANRSIWQSVTRSINTSVTTLFILVLLYIMGVPSIQEFAFPIIAGIVIGTFSSIFLAAPLWATWKDAGVKGK